MGSPPTLRVRLDLGYDGTDFVGWAKQPGLRSVQGELEQALATICRLPVPPAVTCAGRTDSGVHARGQVAHVDLPAAATGPFQLPRFGTNLLAQRAVESQFDYRMRSVLPRDIQFVHAALAPAGFDARFSALSRRYRYFVSDDPWTFDPLDRRTVLQYPRPLDVRAMNRAAKYLLGEHDFAAFCKQRPGATTIRTLRRLKWKRNAKDLVVLRIVADAFCHSMVRSVVGAMLTVGDGRRDAEWLADFLAAGVRGAGVNVVAPHGLVLEAVRYPPDAQLAARAARTRNIRSAVPT